MCWQVSHNGWRILSPQADSRQSARLAENALLTLIEHAPRLVLIFTRMGELSTLDGVYRALADGSRRSIVRRLAAEGELKVTDLARPFDISLNSVSKHIKALEQAGLVQRRVVGRDHWLSLRSEPLAAAYAWIGLYQRFWDSRIDALEQYLGDRQTDVQ